MGIFALSTLLVAGAGIYIFSKVFPNFQPGDKKVQADLQLMRQEVQPEAGDLIPLTLKEMELLASEEEDRTVKKGFVMYVKGKLTTIFHEPVVLYRYKKYISASGKDGLLYAKTAEHEYFFWIKANGTKVVIDNSFIGALENRESLLGGKRKDKLIALIRRKEEEYMPVLIEGREVGSIVRERPGESKGLSTRAFGYVRDDLNAREKAILMALSIYELLARQLD